MTTLESVLSAFKNRFGNYGLYEDQGYMGFKDVMPEVEAFLSRSLKILASELVGAVPEDKHECSHITCDGGEGSDQCQDGDQGEGWNRARKNLLSEIKKRGLE